MKLLTRQAKIALQGVAQRARPYGGAAEPDATRVLDELADFTGFDPPVAARDAQMQRHPGAVAVERPAHHRADVGESVCDFRVGQAARPLVEQTVGQVGEPCLAGGIARAAGMGSLRADALRYLRKEAVNLPEGTPRGYVLVTYRGIPLGWEKNIGNRANNLYPQEWKIKSSHVPETDKPVITW